MRHLHFCKPFGLMLALLLWTALMIRYGIHYAQRSDSDKNKTGADAVASMQDYIDMRRVLLDGRNGKTLDLERVVESMEHDLPSAPLDFFLAHDGQNLRKSDNCAYYPHLLRLKFHNDYWQEYTNGNATYYLYGAYYDKRPEVTRKPLVRILTMVDRYSEPYPLSYCHLWFEERPQPSIVPVLGHQMIWYEEWGTDENQVYPTMVTCQVPDDVSELVPATVSLANETCATPTNNLRVIYEPVPVNGSRGHFAVCSKGLYGPYRDMSVRLVEWLELMRLLGAEKVVIYDLGVHANVSKVFRHYERTGFLEARRITLARGEPSPGPFATLVIKHDELYHRLNQIVALNDCLYRYMYQYEYIAVKDTDEVIMPLGNLTSWADLVRLGAQEPHDNCRGYTAFCFCNVYFPELEQLPPYTMKVPAYLYMLQHVWRVRKHLDPGLATKCLHNTDVVIGVHNHFPMHVADSWCNATTLNETAAQMQHYREPDDKETLNDLVLDESNWRFKEPLVNRSLNVLRELGFFPKVNATEWRRLRAAGQARPWK